MTYAVKNLIEKTILLIYLRININCSFLLPFSLVRIPWKSECTL